MGLIEKEIVFLGIYFNLKSTNSLISPFVEDNRLLVLDGKKVHRVRILKKGFLIQAVQKVFNVAVPFYFNYYPDAFLGGFIPNVMDFVEYLFPDQAGKAFNKL